MAVWNSFWIHFFYDNSKWSQRFLRCQIGSLTFVQYYNKNNFMNDWSEPDQFIFIELFSENFQSAFLDQIWNEVSINHVYDDHFEKRLSNLKFKNYLFTHSKFHVDQNR